MTIPCVGCAQAGTSCCRNYQIILTRGDIQRAAEFLGRRDFFTLEPPVLEDIEPDYDPCWMPMIVSSKGLVRVLKRTAEKDCFLLTETGCPLPCECRPLICRLYPYNYTEAGIIGIDRACPIAKEEERVSLLDGLDMPEDKAKKWVPMLYAEIREEITAIP